MRDVVVGNIQRIWVFSIKKKVTKILSIQGYIVDHDWYVLNQALLYKHRVMLNKGKGI